MILVEPAEALPGLGQLPAAFAARAGVNLVATPEGWTAKLVSQAIESWPQRVAIADGVFLDLLSVTVDGKPIAAGSALPKTGQHVVQLVVTPAYRVSVRSPYSSVFGNGIYRYNSVAHIGVEDERIPMDGPLGLLGGHEQFAGWDGLTADQRIATLTVRGLRDVNAKWRDDVSLPAALLGGFALMLLLITTPVGAPRPPMLAGVDTTASITKKIV